MRHIDLTKEQQNVIEMIVRAESKTILTVAANNWTPMERMKHNPDEFMVNRYKMTTFNDPSCFGMFQPFVESAHYTCYILAKDHAPGILTFILTFGINWKFIGDIDDGLHSVLLPEKQIEVWITDVLATWKVPGVPGLNTYEFPRSLA